MNDSKVDQAEPLADSRVARTPAAPVGFEARADLPFPVVGIGASAGGLGPLTEFFEVVPSDSGIAFVVIQHVAPDRESLMAEILARHTSMPVRQIEDGMAIQPDAVYVIAPGYTVRLSGGKFQLSEPVEQRGHRRPVDDFFRSLAEEQKEKAVVVVLSGTGTNGTAGAQAVKAAGGVCIAQDPETADFPGMPRSLIGAGYADQVLPPRDIPPLLVKYARHPFLQPESSESAEIERVLERDRRHLREILAILRVRTGHQFAGYKHPTLLRRIQRRMGLAGLTLLSDYTALLRDNAEEAATLANDLMINVTGFFRDPDAWEALRTAVITPLVNQHPGDRPIRAWATACASGEEAYTLAMLISEEMQAAGKDIEVRIFATDTADRSLALARAGVYPGGIEGDISNERLDRFFDKEEHTYRIKKHIREMVVFAPHDLLHDPPFSRVDLCTCRNLLIYLEPETQSRVLMLLHFALCDGGYLFLGNAETTGPAERAFSIVSKNWRIYHRVALGQHRPPELPTLAKRSLQKAQSNSELTAGSLRGSYNHLSLQWALLDRCAPPYA
jgi:two-component system, chemotaxis family, CheB/CheR fusion protein